MLGDQRFKVTGVVIKKRGSTQDFLILEEAWRRKN